MKQWIKINLNGYLWGTENKEGEIGFIIDLIVKPCKSLNTPKRLNQKENKAIKNLKITWNKQSFKSLVYTHRKKKVLSLTLNLVFWLYLPTGIYPNTK